MGMERAQEKGEREEKGRKGEYQIIRKEGNQRKSEEEEGRRRPGKGKEEGGRAKEVT